MYHPPINYRTPTYLCEKYTRVAFWNWNPKYIGVFVNSFLLIGDPRKGKHKAQVDERSFQALIKFSNSIIDLHKIKYKNTVACSYELLTPDELINLHPCVKAVRWTPTKLGIFLSTNLLFGLPKGAGNGCLITKRSFELLMLHTKGTMERRKLLFLGDFP